MSARWHTQTIVGGGGVPPEQRGDCVRACITSILGLPITAIENTHGEGWWDRLRGECHRHGYEPVVFDTKYEPPLYAYWIATLPSLNLGAEPDGKPAEHCVVARGYTLIHDPAIGRKYDVAAWSAAWNAEAVTDGWVLVPLDPADLQRGNTAAALDG